MAENVEVMVRPDTDIAVIALRDEVTGLLDYSKGRLVVNQTDVGIATDDLTTMSRLKKALEEKRKEYVSPLNNHVKAINDIFKTISEPLAEADKITRNKVLAWQNEQERQRKEAEELARMQAEVDARVAELRGEIASGELPIVVEEAPAPVAKTTFTDTGSASRSPVRKWEVVDESQVPREYMMIDSAKIQSVVKARIPSIAGIRIWEEQTLQIRPRG